jgi:hypothetical protein
MLLDKTGASTVVIAKGSDGRMRGDGRYDLHFDFSSLPLSVEAQLRGNVEESA